MGHLTGFFADSRSQPKFFLTMKPNWFEVIAPVEIEASNQTEALGQDVSYAAIALTIALANGISKATGSTMIFAAVTGLSVQLAAI